MRLGKNITHGSASQTACRLRQLVLAGVVLGGLAACSRAPELAAIPVAEEVAEITVSHAGEKRVIVNRATITKVLATLNRVNRDWSSPPTTYPTPELTVVFKLRGSDGERVFWIGEGWLGTQSQTTEVGDETMKKLRRALGSG